MITLVFCVHVLISGISQRPDSLRLKYPPRQVLPSKRQRCLPGVEDTAVLLQLYHQPPEDIVPAATIINPGGMSLLKEPYLKKAASDGTYSLRVDYVSDVST